MKKINNYFPHDFNARNDIKLKKVNMQLGLSGIGLYWCIIEYLYENGGYLTLDEDINLLAYELRIEKDLIINLIENFDLFKIKNNKFFSQSVLSRLEDINRKSNINRKNSLKRWQKNEDLESNTKAMRPHTSRKATDKQTQCYIKEKKIKENKNKINNNITTTTTNNIYSFIEENFGRTLSGIEFSKLNNWLSEFDEDIIKYAIEISVMNQKKSFAYVDGILRNWKSDNYKSLEEIKIVEKEKIENEEKSLDQEILNYDWLNEGGNNNDTSSN